MKTVDTANARPTYDLALAGSVRKPALVPLWKRLVLGLYYHGSDPYRRWQGRRLGALGAAPVTVLIFHRIADDAANDWTTPTATFRAGIDWLQRRFDLISLEEAQRRIRTRTSRRPSVSITFDDGYAVNCRVALPLLIERKVPCTYFVSTGPVLQGVPFEHDLQMGHRFAPNTVDELRAMSRGGIEIGAHSRTHADFGLITSPEQMQDELVVARDELQDAVGRAVRYFAFPFGLHANLSVAAIELARQTGFAGVCSAYCGYNFPGDDAFHLQRCGVDGPLVRQKNWASVDPIRGRRVRRFAYDAPARECGRSAEAAS